MTREQAIENALRDVIGAYDKGFDGWTLYGMDVRAALALPPDNADMLAALQALLATADMESLDNRRMAAVDASRAAIARATA